jgi:aldehyde dehydrogenase (NAD+)
MRRLQHYIDGRWAPSVEDGIPFAVVNPATEQVVAELSMASTLDVDLAVKFACSAFPAYSMLALADRILLLRRLMAVFERRYGEMVEAITTEMGAPHNLSQRSQAAAGPGHIKATLDAALAWEERSGRLAT